MRSPALLPLLLALALVARCRARALKGAPEIKADVAAAPAPTLEPPAPERAPAAAPRAPDSGAPGRGLKQSCADRTSWCSSWASRGYCSSGYVYNGQSVATYWCPASCRACGSGSAGSGSSSGGSGALPRSLPVAASLRRPLRCATSQALPPDPQELARPNTPRPPRPPCLPPPLPRPQATGGPSC